MQLKEFVKKEIRGFWGDEATPETGIPVIKTNNLTYEGVINYADINYRQIDASKIKDNYLQEGDLLIEKSGGTKTHSVGYVSYFDGEPNKFVCNNFILALRLDDEKIRPKFAFYQLKYLYESGHFSHCYRQTTGIQNLQKEQYLGTEIIVPEIAEQDKIIKILDNLTANCEKNSKKLQKFDELIKSQFSELFGDLQSNSKNWEEKKIEDYFHVHSSKRVYESDWKKEGVPFYRAREIVKLDNDGFVDNELYITPEMYKEYSEKYGKPKEGDILITAVGTLGICYVVRASDEFYFKDGNIIWLEKQKEISSEFLYYEYKDQFIQKQIHKQSGATVGTYTIINAKQTKILVPPIELQNQFADFVKHIDKLKFAIKKSIEKLELCYQSLMKEYFG